MTLDKALMIWAGSLILISVLLATLFSSWWLLLTAFVGLNLVQYPLTDFCPIARLFERLGVAPPCQSLDKD